VSAIVGAVLKRLAYGREGPAVTVLDLSDCAALPLAKQAGEVFESALPATSHCQGETFFLSPATFG
jgi:hypothetical protein